MIKRTLHRLSLRAERLYDRFFHRTGAGREIDPYIGYATPEGVVLRGRVLSHLHRDAPLKTQSKLANLRDMFELFLTDEVADAEVRSGSVTTRTDEEGYFTLHLPRDLTPGWTSRAVTVEDGPEVACPVMIPREDAAFIVISDIDDTMLRTGAYSLIKNLYTSFTGNSATREVFSDSIDLMQDLHDGGRNPVFYVSSSPWNLHDFLSDIFDNTGLVKGPMFLRDLGLSETKFITEGHGNHKGASIDTILAANPDLPAILLGDTGQHDAQIYRDVIDRHPGRIRAVGLRAPGPGLDAADRHDLAALSDTEVTVFSGPDFTGFSESVKTAHPDLFEQPAPVQKAAQ
ncbi:App1 family protein [Pseudooctadecabacter sp.]|uniref:App1 family protein n=1 Tax=Pseudooctadecabacter sp. TaxID=1966338 RepID=UPI0025EABB0E|nr:phosphatase domain-containing protein [Pseudooctadecabacter sp.]